VVIATLGLYDTMHDTKLIIGEAVYRGRHSAKDLRVVFTDRHTADRNRLRIIQDNQAVWIIGYICRVIGKMASASN